MHYCLPPHWLQQSACMEHCVDVFNKCAVKLFGNAIIFRFLWTVTHHSIPSEHKNFINSSFMYSPPWSDCIYFTFVPHCVTNHVTRICRSQGSQPWYVGGRVWCNRYGHLWTMCNIDFLIPFAQEMVPRGLCVPCYQAFHIMVDCADCWSAFVWL